MGQRGKKSLKITDAVVRGGKIAYEFEVFPIETEFEPQSAVYIFSQRKTDKKGRGHQQFFCIGQTDSLDGEFSKYKKQFASKYKANVICVRIEEEAKLRSEIEQELKGIYSISCSSNIEKISAKPAKRLPAKQILEDKKSVQPKKETVITDPLQKSPTKTLVEKEIKSAARKDSIKVSQKDLSNKADKSDSSKFVAKTNKKTTVEDKVAVRNKKPSKKIRRAKSKAVKSSVVPVKAKSPQETVKPTSIKNKKTSAVRNKIETKKSKAVSTKPKDAKISKLSKNQVTLTAEKSKNDNSGKAPSRNKQKTAMQKVANKGGKRTSKSASRKQLAF